MELDPVTEVDLTTGVVTRRRVEPDEARRVLGGRGLVALGLLGRPAADPLSPDNPLLVFAGLLTGTAVPASSRVHIGARSPLTSLSGSSNVGGRIGRALRRAAVGGLVVRGAARRPSYLLLSQGGLEIRRASPSARLDAAHRPRRRAPRAPRLHRHRPRTRRRPHRPRRRHGVETAQGHRGRPAAGGRGHAKPQDARLP
jgi:hypothetical protein